MELSYNWKLKDTVFKKDKGTVFSCFACGGGSSMGYKLAGYDVIGVNDIDPRMMEVYVKNHNPKYSYVESITTFCKRDDLPKELYDLDILDGSPPCSSFSMAGNREKDWGKEKMFKEGQAKQVLDTLFFDFIYLAKRLKPKVVIAENVKGLLLGNAKEYVRKIYESFDNAGYYCQHFLLDASKMGVPQKRERVFFICIRKDLAGKFLYQKDMFSIVPKIEMVFNEKEIPFKKIYEPGAIGLRSEMYPSHSRLWDNKKPGDYDMSQASIRTRNKKVGFNNNYVYLDKVINTITAHKDNASNVLFDEKRYLSKSEILKGGTFPLDFNFLKMNPGFIVGMSVPPLMVAKIANKVYEQWLSKI